MSKTRVDSYLLIVLSFSMFVNVGLILKVRKLEIANQPKITEQLSIGAKVESLDALDMTGKPRHLALTSGGKPVVLYVFSPTCGWCAKNLSNIKQIYELKKSNFNFIGVSLSAQGVPQYVSASGFPLDVVQSPSATSREKFHFNGTPETIVVDASGRVQQVWVGAYSSRTCRRIETFFQLPQGSLTAVPANG